MPAYKSYGLANMADGSVAEAPQFLPMKFTDESILNIPIPYSAIYPPEDGGEVKKERKGSLLGKLTGGRGRKKEGFKMVKMTRKEYLMYWYVPCTSCFSGSLSPKGNIFTVGNCILITSCLQGEG